MGMRQWDPDYGKVWQSDFLLLASCGYDDILMPYIEKGIVTPDHATPNGFDMYYYAAVSGNPYLMMHLLPYLEDINSKRYDNGHYFGMTLLFIASASGNTETVKVLLENGIDENIYATDAGGNKYWHVSVGMRRRIYKELYE
jgi:ankyrin repeat protein